MTPQALITHTDWNGDAYAVVVSSRPTEHIAVRVKAAWAEGVADYLNELFDGCDVWPAHDVLVHEVICARVGGAIG